MNALSTHKAQAFYLTTLCFLPLIIGFFYTTSYFKPMNQENFTLSMQQFIAQSYISHSQQSAQQPYMENNKPIPRKHKIHKKHKHIRDKSFSQSQTTTQPQNNTNSVSPQNTSETQTQFFSYGKDNNPFLKAVKLATDNATIYPRQARKIRIQGKVLVEFLWTKQKQLKDLKIIKSSGYEILDKNTLQTIQRASVDFPVYTNNVRLQIPIIYQLKD
ncbi:MAG: energy transducer TonB [Helicobacter sp.]|uniref:energy transducer TonB n=1 Tax=Helicobacter sp. TaxID=218 RepID=UPI0023BD8480|nr:energy transducer TonB [Helicobacter sp.]MDE5925992.1 energy transducer TonB [Helicobacter sp.]MDE7175363.1 energy transducer TonB [Helicobacter sp.]